MTEKSIIFSSESVKAILGGRKTQTRRVGRLKYINEESGLWEFQGISKESDGWWFEFYSSAFGEGRNIKPRYQVGDRLWVRETTKAVRIWLEVINVRVKRLQDINVKDITAEGINDGLNNRCPKIARNNFKALWDSINGKKYPWDSNPWVWVIKFKVIKKRNKK